MSKDPTTEAALESIIQLATQAKSDEGVGNTLHKLIVIRSIVKDAIDFQFTRRDFNETR